MFAALSLCCQDNVTGESTIGGGRKDCPIGTGNGEISKTFFAVDRTVSAAGFDRDTFFTGGGGAGVGSTVNLSTISV